MIPLHTSLQAPLVSPLRLRRPETCTTLNHHSCQRMMRKCLQVHLSHQITGPYPHHRQGHQRCTPFGNVVIVRLHHKHLPCFHLHRSPPKMMLRSCLEARQVEWICRIPSCPTLCQVYCKKKPASTCILTMPWLRQQRAMSQLHRLRRASWRRPPRLGASTSRHSKRDETGARSSFAPPSRTMCQPHVPVRLNLMSSQSFSFLTRCTTRRTYCL